MVKQDDPLISDENIEVVFTGESVQIDINDADYNLKKLEHSDLIMAISFSENEAEQSHKEAQGNLLSDQEKTTQSTAGKMVCDHQ